MPAQQSEKRKFASRLLKWNKEKNTREMPWKGEKNPYLIWLSEIILQQTRVEQGLPYFLKFRRKYPTVAHLAKAREDEVMKMWQGLGYYSRARNLHTTAKYIHKKLKGKFPETFDEIRKLKGVGDYTASAIASFAFGEPKAVVDGNVIRVLSRVFGIETPFDTTEGKKVFASLATEMIDKKQPGIYNQAIMDFGAVVCVPRSPDCLNCPFRKVCVAFSTKQIETLPVRKGKIKLKERFFNYLVVEHEGQILIRKRTGNDIWRNLYELPLIETKQKFKGKDSLISEVLGTKKFTVKSISSEIVQQLSHQKIHFRFIHVLPENKREIQQGDAKWVKIKSLGRYAFPKTIHLYLAEKPLL